MNAKTVCEIAWYAQNAGAQGVTGLMYKAGPHTGNFSHHLKRALGSDHDTELVCAVRVPAPDRYDQNHTVMDLTSS